jgi:hypothetical protein
MSQKKRREIHLALIRLKERIARYDPNKGPALETFAQWLLRRDELEAMIVEADR